MSTIASTSPARRYLSLDLTHLRTDRLLRALFGRNWRSAGLAERAPPFTVHAKEKSAFRLIALNETAERLGLRRGQALAEARAMIPSLESAEADFAADEALLDDIADWADRFTPLVAVDGEHGLMLDISGCAHLFGGEMALLQDLLARLHSHGFAARGAIADTPGAAYAVARFGTEMIVPGGEMAELLARLPVAALRLPGETVFALERVGLKTVERLLTAPRAPLAARFGNLLLRRIDQALGFEDESISPRRPAPVLMAERRFPDPITEVSDVEAVLASLAVALEKGLVARVEGARLIELALFRVDGAVSRLEVGTSRPTRAAKRVSDLFREKFAGLADALDPGYGFDMVRLSALRAERASASQIDMDGSREGEADLTRLVDRIGARLGLGSISRMLPADSHWPERAMRMAPAALVDDLKTSWASLDENGTIERPLRLLARPEPVKTVAEVPDGPPVIFEWRRTSYKVVRAEGPERLAPEWWRSGEELLSRDYFRIEDEAGRRFWLFREGLYERETDQPRWYLHGLCA